MHLHHLTWPLHKGEHLSVEFKVDVTGDGVVDLVTNDGGQRVRVYAGSRYSVAESPVAESPVAEVAFEVPPTDDAFFAHDLTGDGRGEILIWGPGQRRGTVVRGQP